MRFMSKAALFCLWCFVFSLTWDAFTSLPVLGSIPRVVGLVASVVGIGYVLARRSVRPLSWFHVFALLFVLAAGVSSFWSIDPDVTRERFLTLLQLAIFLWLIWEIAWSPESGRVLLQAYVLGACVLAVANIHNFVTGVTGRGGGVRYVAMNQDPNELGLILALAIPMAWYLGLAPPRGRLAQLWHLYLPVGLTGMLLTASRGAFLTACVALTIVPWTLGRVRLRTKVMLGALALGSAALAISFIPEASLERILTVRADIESGYFGGRGRIWRAGLEVAREHPLVGVGAGAFGAAVLPALSRDMASHQIWLQIVVEQGMVGLVLFLVMLWAAVKPLGQLPPFERRLWIILLACLGVGSLSLHLVFRKYFWFVLGLLAAQAALRPAPRVPARATLVRAPGPGLGQERHSALGAGERAIP